MVNVAMKGKTMIERIIQFGEGNFLRGFIEPLIQSLHDQGTYDGSVVMIQPQKSGRIKELQVNHNQYHCLVRGVFQEEVFDEIIPIRVVSRGIDPYVQWDEFISLANQPQIEVVISNTTESGIIFNQDDQKDQVASTFPGKLTQLLWQRYQHNLSGWLHLPCELIDNNGEILRATVIKYAKHWKYPDDFIRWIEEYNVFANTLVDRIVSGYPHQEIEIMRQRIGYDDPNLVATEVFHFWAIQGYFDYILPFSKHPNVLYTGDIAPYKKRKVRILNGAHTALVSYALLKGYTEVKETLDNPEIFDWLKEIIFDEIIPSLDLDYEMLIEFAFNTLERFKNPFIHHQLSSIALNTFDKFKVRVIPSMVHYHQKKGYYPPKLMEAFDAFYELYQTKNVQDTEYAKEYMKSHTKEEVFNYLCSFIQ